MREPLDCFRDKRVTDLVLCFGTQTGKTMTVMGGTGYRIANDPANALWVMPNRDLCKSFTQTRWFPFIENCAPLEAMRPSGADRHLWTRLEQYFSRSTLTWVGSNSPSNLASRPAGLLLMDEIDKFELKSDREAGALQNAEERTKASTYPLRVKTSTPTTKYGEIWKEFQMGDQRFFFLPCPHCRTKIRLEWGQVRWWDQDDSESKTDGEWDLEKVRKNTYYRCQACEQKIYDSQKTVMLREGEWQPTATNGLLGRRSYHLNSLYAPLKETQWGNLAVKWLMTKGSATRRQAFINSTLAEPWDNELLVDDETINVITYSPSELPDDRIPVMTVDVQENHFWVVVRSLTPFALAYLGRPYHPAIRRQPMPSPPAWPRRGRETWGRSAEQRESSTAWESTLSMTDAARRETRKLPPVIASKIPKHPLSIPMFFLFSPILSTLLPLKPF